MRSAVAPDRQVLEIIPWCQLPKLGESQIDIDAFGLKIHIIFILDNVRIKTHVHHTSLILLVMRKNSFQRKRNIRKMFYLPLNPFE